MINHEVLANITIINTVKASYFLEWSRSGIFSRSYLWRGALEWSGEIFWEGRDKRSLLLKKWSISKSAHEYRLCDIIAKGSLVSAPVSGARATLFGNRS